MKKQTLLAHTAAIQTILFVKSTKLSVEHGFEPTTLGEREFIKIQTSDSLCHITTEPLVSYCKKNKIDLKIRGAYDKFDDPVTEIEIS